METNDRAGLALALSLARAESQEALKPLRPGPERAVHRVRPLGHVGQGRRRHAGGFQRNGSLQLGQSHREPEAGGDGQESGESDEECRNENLRRV